MRLKKLEWQKTIEGDYEANALGGSYVLHPESKDLGWRFGTCCRPILNNQGRHCYPSIEKAMDAAQLDFERMVCECYEYPEQAEAVHE